MTKLEPYQEEQKLLAEWAGLIFQGLDECGEIEFLGTKEQFNAYNEVMSKEVLRDKDGRHYFMDESENGTAGEDGYQGVETYKVYLD